MTRFTEQKRLEALKSLHILDTSPDRPYDQIARLAAMYVDTPMALVSFVDEARQWWKASVGLQGSELDREDAFCDTVVETTKRLIVENASEHPDFRDNPLVARPPYVRFYTGLPVHVDGHVVGTLCALDTRPRALTQRQLRALCMLRDQLEDRLEARRAELELRRTGTLFRQIVESVEDAVWVVSDDGGSIEYCNDRVESLWGVTRTQLRKNPACWISRLHPDDRPRVLQAIDRSIASRHLDVEYRVMTDDGAVRWLRSRVVAAGAGDPAGIVGTTTDITDRVARPFTR